ncbi:hypothetical protein ACFL1H_00700 [Nanoarchaeota archaeon]
MEGEKEKKLVGWIKYLNTRQDQIKSQNEDLDKRISNLEKKSKISPIDTLDEPEESKQNKLKQFATYILSTLPLIIYYIITIYINQKNTITSFVFDIPFMIAITVVYIFLLLLIFSIVYKK